MTSYTFEPVERCRMCGVPTTNATVMGRRLDRSQGIRPARRAGVTTTVKRCASCGLVFADPLPIPGDVLAHYDKAPQDYWPPHRLEAVTATDGDQFADVIARFSDLWGGSGRPRSLDVGAGLGLTMSALSRAGFDVRGIEPSPSFARYAIERHGVPSDALQLCALEDAEFPESSFDFVSFGAVLEHLQDPAASLDRTLGWCSPGGLVHVEVPSADWLTSRMVNAVYRVQRSGFAANLSPMHPPYHLYEFTPASFAAYASSRGHEVALMQRYVGDRTFLPRALDRIGRAVMRRTGTGMQIEVWLRRGPA